jgi:hypothetical protein
MRRLLILLSLFITMLSAAQQRKVAGTYSTTNLGGLLTGTRVTFYPDFTFDYFTDQDHPVFSRWENLSERGRWTMSGDTVILNPHLERKPAVEAQFSESIEGGDATLRLTFHHIKRYFDREGNLTKADTLQIDRLDFAFNELKKKGLRRVTPRPTTRCAFAGYIPPEIITSGHSITVNRPEEGLRSIFIGCYELQDTKEYLIKNPLAGHLTFTVYSNYYADGQIRQLKFLVYKDKALYTRQKPSGRFYKGDLPGRGSTLKRQKNSA